MSNNLSKQQFYCKYKFAINFIQKIQYEPRSKAFGRLLVNEADSVDSMILIGNAIVIDLLKEKQVGILHNCAIYWILLLSFYVTTNVTLSISLITSALPDFRFVHDFGCSSVSTFPMPFAILMSYLNAMSANAQVLIALVLQARGY